jgi:uncharacterized protein YqeY
MLAEQLQSDLTAAMKARDELTRTVLRSAIAAVKEARVSGDEAHAVSDDDVIALLAKEAKKREEAAAAYDDGGRPEQAERERAEGAVLARYLPAPLTGDELTETVDRIIAEGGYSSPKDMGPVMREAQTELRGRADGKALSALVKARLRPG